MSIVTSLNNFVSSASALPDFSPALGHTYMPPASKTKAADSLGQASKEPTPAPESVQAKKPYTVTQTSAQLNNQLLAETVRISMQYGDEYMDEAPITGQPGDFHLSTSGRKDKLMVPAPGKAGAGVASKPTPPPPLKTDIPPARKTSKSEKSPRTPGMPKLKRRKSKALTSAGGISPT